MLAFAAGMTYPCGGLTATATPRPGDPTMRPIALAAALGFALASRGTAADPTPPAVEQVLKELDLASPPDRLGDLPKGYDADGVTEADVRQNPKKYRLRMKVLDAVDALAQARRLGVEDLRVPYPYREATKAVVRDRQQVLAASIAELAEAVADLKKVAADRAAEPKRWQAHYDYVLAEARFRIAALEEYNAALGRVVIEELPDLNAKAGETGWRLVPADTFVGGGATKKRLAAAHDDLGAVATAHPKSPWAKLADNLSAARVGLKWEPTKIPVGD